MSDTEPVKKLPSSVLPGGGAGSLTSLSEAIPRGFDALGRETTTTDQ
jgi:hypothetical protein